jgi:hypothetical protein
MRYQPVSDAYTVYRVTAADPDADPGLTELCELDGWRYLSVPSGLALAVPPPIAALETVVLDDTLRARIKAASPHITLIDQRFDERLRARYTLNTELYYARIASGVALGVYSFLPNEQDELAAYQVYVEGLRTQSRAEKVALGL